MTVDLTKITATFGTLPRETQIALFEARLDGEVIEHYLQDSRWMYVTDPFWLSCKTYRVRPTPVTYDSINWDHVAPQFIAMARDENGNVHVYYNPPKHSTAMWYPPYEGKRRADHFTSYTRGTCDWKDSLVLRPEVA